MAVSRCATTSARSAAVRPIRAVLFDAAGTLIEPAEAIGASYARIARAHGVTLPPARIEEAFGRVLAAAQPMLFPGEPLARVAELERAWWREIVRGTFRAADGCARLADPEAAFDALFRHYAAPRAWRARPGARAALSALRERGLRTGVVSNFDLRLRPILAGLGLHELLDTVVLPAEAGAAKPAPAIFAVALKRLGRAAFQTLFVGDHAEQDVAASRGAGMRALDVGSLATLAELPERLDALAEEPR